MLLDFVPVCLYKNLTAEMDILHLQRWLSAGVLLKKLLELLDRHTAMCRKTGKMNNTVLYQKFVGAFYPCQVCLALFLLKELEK